MPIYRLRKTKVEAIQFTGGNTDEVEEFIGEKVTPYMSADLSTDKLALGVRNPQLSALILDGDYVVRLPNGSFTVFTEDSFEQTYKPIKESNNDLMFN